VVEGEGVGEGEGEGWGALWAFRVLWPSPNLLFHGGSSPDLDTKMTIPLGIAYKHKMQKLKNIFLTMGSKNTHSLDKWT
jgi:hypothetical protein